MSRNTTKSSTSVDTTEATFDAETVSAYKSATDRKAQGAVRSQVKANVSAAIKALDITAAAYWTATLEALTTDKPASTKVELNPGDVVRQRVADLELALQLMKSGEVTPTGLDCSGVDFGDLSFDLVGDDDTARKLASAKITRSTERHSIREVIERAFDGQPSGTSMKISEVAHAGSTDDYRPSQGAIAAHFGSDGRIDGYRLLDADSDGNPRRVVSE